MQLDLDAARDDASSRTRTSLILDIGRGPQSTRWEEFDRKYRRIVLGMVRQSGMGHHDAEDVTQDIFRELAASLGSFQPTGRPGSFRRYLCNLVRWRVCNRLKLQSQHHRRTTHANDADSAQEILEGIPDPQQPSDNRDVEFREAVTEAMRALAEDLAPRDLQLLDSYFLKNWSAAEVANALGISRANVFTIAHRHKLRLIREILRRL